MMKFAIDSISKTLIPGTHLHCRCHKLCVSFFLGTLEKLHTEIRIGPILHFPRFFIHQFVLQQSP